MKHVVCATCPVKRTRECASCMVKNPVQAGFTRKAQSGIHRECGIMTPAIRSRCTPMDRCDNYYSCLDIASLLGWPGWKVTRR